MKKPLKTCRVCDKKAYTEEDLKEFKGHNNSTYNKERLCLSCHLKQSSERYKEKVVERNTFIEEYIGGFKCKDCGIEHPSITFFDFHHLDPTQKEIVISKAKMWSTEKLTKELDKCVCLCPNCHRLRHLDKEGKRI